MEEAKRRFYADLICAFVFHREDYHPAIFNPLKRIVEAKIRKAVA